MLGVVSVNTDGIVCSIVYARAELFVICIVFVGAKFDSASAELASVE